MPHNRKEIIENLQQIALFLESIGEDVSSSEISDAINYINTERLGDFCELAAENT